jgi:alanine racemase
MDRGFIYLNKTNFLNNLLFLKKSTKKNLCLVVKANAYGHGVEWAVNSAIKAGVAWFAVASVDEGVQVKEYANEARVLLLSEPSISQLEKIRINNLDLKFYQCAN